MTNARAVAVVAAPGSVGEHARAHDRPVEIRSANDGLLASLVPEVQRQDDGADKKRVVESHLPPGIGDAEGSLADEPADAVALHGADQIAGTLRENASGTEPLFVPSADKTASWPWVARSSEAGSRTFPTTLVSPGRTSDEAPCGPGR